MSSATNWAGCCGTASPITACPPKVLDKDIQYILDAGVEVVLDTEVGGPDLSLEQLKAQYDAVYISIGAP